MEKIDKLVKDYQEINMAPITNFLSELYFIAEDPEESGNEQMVSLVDFMCYEDEPLSDLFKRLNNITIYRDKKNT